MNTPQGQSVIVPPQRIEKSGRELVQAPDESSSLLQIIARAARDPATDMDKMERLLKMQETIMAKRAEQAFVAALSEFKARPLAIRKNKHVAFQTTKGLTEYDHATLDEICRAVNPGLAAVGLSYRWNTVQGDGGRITVTCILTHRDGHSERTSLTASPDDSGGKNNIQAIGSATSYLQRYTLLAAIGVATGGVDDDGRGGQAAEKITEAQAADLTTMIKDKGMSLKKFVEFFKVETLDDLPAARHGEALNAVKAYVPKAQRAAAPAAQGALV